MPKQTASASTEPASLAATAPLSSEMPVKSALQADRKLAKKVKKGLGDSLLEQVSMLDTQKLGLLCKLVDAARDQ